MYVQSSLHRARSRVSRNYATSLVSADIPFITDAHIRVSPGSDVSEQIAILAFALLAYEGSVWIGGNGFVAAFVASILSGAITRGALEPSGLFNQTLGLSAPFVVWAIFGAVFVGDLFGHEITAQPIVYAIVSLTLIRMVPVAMAMIGMHLRPATVAFMGWFGPRGLASVVLTLIAIEDRAQQRCHDGGADGHLDNPVLGGVAWCLGLAHCRAVRSIDSEGGQRAGDGAGRRT